jgi:hypothetical protein
MALTRAQKKLMAIQRANRRLQGRLDDIDWELDYLAPKVAELAKLEASENVTVELGPGDVEDEDH